MPQESLEAFIQRMIADIASLLAELIDDEDAACRMELLLVELFHCAMEELRRVQPGMNEEYPEKSAEAHSSADNTLSALKGSSPETPLYAFPAKKIEQRFRD
jgi:hypothetical protein